MNPVLMIIGLVGTLTFGALTAALAVIFYKKETGMPYSFLNRFPFEIMLALDYQKRRLIQVPVILTALSIIAFFFGAVYAPSLFLPIAIVATSLFALIAFIFLFYVKTTVIERHVLASSLFMMLTLMLSFLTAYYAFETPFTGVYGDVLKYGAFVIGAFQLLIMVNPKLKNWGRLEQQKSGEAVSYVRPRIFVLPFSEWLTFLNIVLLQVLYFVSLYL